MKLLAKLIIAASLLYGINYLLDNEDIIALASNPPAKINKPYLRINLIETAVYEQFNPLLDVDFIKAIIEQESSWRSNAKNETSRDSLNHSYGLMQVSRAKAIDYRISVPELHDDETNIFTGTRIASKCLWRESSKFAPHLRKSLTRTIRLHALACYNGGEGWRDKTTRRANALRYAHSVMSRYERIKRESRIKDNLNT